MQKERKLKNLTTNLEVAKLQAKVLGHSYKREVCFLALHGFLHLLGYDHIEKDEEKEMNLTSEKILAKHEVKRWNLAMLQLLEELMQVKAH